MAENYALDNDTGNANDPSLDRLQDSFIDNVFSTYRLEGNSLFKDLQILLTGLGFEGDSRHLCEATPYQIDDFTTQNFIQSIGNLGYKLNYTATFDKQNECFRFPYLCTDVNGESLVVLGQSRSQKDKLIIHRDGHLNRVHVNECVGMTMFYFSSEFDLHDHPVNKMGVDTVSKLMRRFKEHRNHLVILSVVLMLVRLAMPLYVMSIYNRVLPAESTSTLIALAVGVGIALLADFVMRNMRSQLLIDISNRFDFLVSQKVLRHLLSLNPVTLEATKPHTHLYRWRDIASIKEFISSNLTQALLDFPSSILFAIVLTILSPKLGGIIFLAAFLLLTAGWLARRSFAESAQATAAITSMKHKLGEEILEENELLRFSGRLPKWQKAFQLRSILSARASMTATQQSSLVSNFSYAIIMTGGVCVIAVGALEVMAGNLMPGVLIAAMILVWRTLTPLQSVSLGLAKLKQVRGAAARIDDLFSIPPETNTQGLVRSANGVQGEMELKNVMFRYEVERQPALMNINLKVKHGEMIVISGDSGAGKSTLMKVMAGMLQPNSGSVKVNQFDIRRFNPSEYRREVGYLPDTVSIFHGTLTQNLIMANIAATKAELSAVCRALNLTRNSTDLPEGLDTWFHDDKDYSASLTTRIGIARILLKKPKLILLDEPHNHLDDFRVHELVPILKTLKKRSTIVVITNNAAIKRIADKEVVMSEGQIARVNGISKSVKVAK